MYLDDGVLVEIKNKYWKYIYCGDKKDVRVCDETKHLLKCEHVLNFDEDYVYKLCGTNDVATFISLNYWQNKKLLLFQNKLWIQKEENIRYLINLLFLIGGIIIGVLNIFK